MANDSTNNEMLEYRSIHTGAILGLLIGLLSITILFAASSDIQRTLMLVPIPIAGALVSYNAMRAISAAKEVYTGEKFAQAGLFLSLLFLIGGVSYSGYVYSTEVPDGYERTSFLEMKPTDADMVNRELIPDEMEALLGKQIFIKGYIRPSGLKYKKNIDNFLLVRDNQECCFGAADKVKFYDQVNVKLGPGQTTDYHTGMFRVGGILSIGPGSGEYGTPFTYQIKADYIRD